MGAKAVGRELVAERGDAEEHLAIRQARFIAPGDVNEIANALVAMN